MLDNIFSSLNLCISCCLVSTYWSTYVTDLTSSGLLFICVHTTYHFFGLGDAGLFTSGGLDAELEELLLDGVPALLDDEVAQEEELLAADDPLEEDEEEEALLSLLEDPGLEECGLALFCLMLIFLFAIISFCGVLRGADGDGEDALLVFALVASLFLPCFFS